ncbi:hypothetical protein [Croceicoccus mobilis]|uniref:hypothetical protein n=1 Tax=Croceicoccus mobilis TaxID=1703339 RepID=UPI0012E94C74|nr:hypothetical protein [Croceicoccus mobilis]
MTPPAQLDDAAVISTRQNIAVTEIRRPGSTLAISGTAWNRSGTASGTYIYL